jgi:hypothetical protein
MEEGTFHCLIASYVFDANNQGTKVKFAGAGNEDEHGQSQ